MIFLVTPTFAAAAANDNGSIFSQIISKASNHAPKDYETLIAVVDRLPRPSSAPFDDNTENAIYRANNLDLEDSGLEGLAFASTTISAFALKGRPASATISGRGSSLSLSDHNKYASLTFNMHVYSQRDLDTLSQTGNQGRIPENISSSVQVPLAQTVFMTGMQHTLLHSIWSQTSDHSYERLSTRNLDQFDVTLPLLPELGHFANSVSLSLPLIALTNAKPVVKCMGNIVRQLNFKWPVADSESNFPASTELETAVSEYFKARSIPSQSVSVWALVVPRDSERILGHNWMMENLVGLSESFLQKNWESSRPQTGGKLQLSTLWRFMHAGAKLRRVMSGGGGWGKKAGLLSLDPDSSYDPLPQNLVAPDTTPDFWDARESSPVGQVANEGDLVQFFIWPYGVDMTKEKKTSSDVSCIRSSVEFGVIPSTIDSVPGSDVQDATSASQVLVYNNHFGALSESGMAVGHSSLESGESTHDLLKEDKHRSKVDVPFARFSHIDIGTSVHDDNDGVRPSETTRQSVAPLKPEATESQISDRLIGANSAIKSTIDELYGSPPWRQLTGRAKKAKFWEIVELKKKLNTTWKSLKRQKRATDEIRDGEYFISLTSDDPLESSFASSALALRKYYGFAESQGMAFKDSGFTIEEVTNNQKSSRQIVRVVPYENRREEAHKKHQESIAAARIREQRLAADMERIYGDFWDDDQPTSSGFRARNGIEETLDEQDDGVRYTYRPSSTSAAPRGESEDASDEQDATPRDSYCPLSSFPSPAGQSMDALVEQDARSQDIYRSLSSGFTPDRRNDVALDGQDANPRDIYRPLSSDPGPDGGSEEALGEQDANPRDIYRPLASSTRPEKGNNDTIDEEDARLRDSVLALLRRR